MKRTTQPLGDAHNFGRRVSATKTRIDKPRTLVWEQLLLSAKSPLRTFLSAQTDLGVDAFSFLPDLAFFDLDGRNGGEVERVSLTPLETLKKPGKRELTTIVGRALALFTWLGLSDLHWENLVLGRDSRGKIIFAPLDVEMILADLSLPTETKLLPDADPEVAAICQHACGVRRVLPYLGKPIPAGSILEIASAYLQTLAFLDHHAKTIAGIFARIPKLDQIPIRVLLRGTDEYMRMRTDGSNVWPPLLDAESEQLARGDIPYFFRLYGKPGIFHFANASLTKVERLPTKGDVPQLEPLLDISKSLRSSSRKKLREDGLFAVIGAFDHPKNQGDFASEEIRVTFAPRSLRIRMRGGDELESRRNLSAFVGSVYQPCKCGEVRTVFVPPVTVCSDA